MIIYARLCLTKIIFFMGLTKYLAHNHPHITTIFMSLLTWGSIWVKFLVKFFGSWPFAVVFCPRHLVRALLSWVMWGPLEEDRRVSIPNPFSQKHNPKCITGQKDNKNKRAVTPGRLSHWHCPFEYLSVHEREHNVPETIVDSRESLRKKCLGMGMVWHYLMGLEPNWIKKSSIIAESRFGYLKVCSLIVQCH